MKEKNGMWGIIFSIIITFAFIAISPQWFGIVFFRDFDFAVGLFFGLLFALKYRKPDQSALKFGITLGLIAGCLSTIAPGFLFWILFGGHIIYIFINIGYLLITGIVFGFIMGGFLGWFYMSKDTPKKGEEKYNDDFFEDLVEK